MTSSRIEQSQSMTRGQYQKRWRRLRAQVSRVVLLSSMCCRSDTNITSQTDTDIETDIVGGRQLTRIQHDRLMSGFSRFLSRSAMLERDGYRRRVRPFAFTRWY